MNFLLSLFLKLNVLVIVYVVESGRICVFKSDVLKSFIVKRFDVYFFVNGFKVFAVFFVVLMLMLCL